MSLHVSRRYQLSAAHRLFCPELSDEQNADLFGKCANPFGHGHNYQVEVTVSGVVDAATGMVCDLGMLDRCVEQRVLDEYDHANLNLHADFRGCVPTTENFCMAIYGRLRGALGARLAQVHVEETSNNAFTYAGSEMTIEALQYRRAARRWVSREREKRV